MPNTALPDDASRSDAGASGRRQVSHLVAVCGPPGCGKSSLVRALASALGDATMIFHDSYEHVTRQSPAALRQWLDHGADFNEFVIAGLPEDLERLRRGEAVTDPATGREVRPAKYVLFESQFGRAHRATGKDIEILVWIDVPLDVALARRLKQYTRSYLTEHPPQSHGQCLEWFGAYLESYLGVVHDTLVKQADRISGDADIVVDGNRDPITMARQVAEQIRSRL